MWRGPSCCPSSSRAVAPVWVSAERGGGDLAGDSKCPPPGARCSLRTRLPTNEFLCLFLSVFRHDSCVATPGDIA